MIICFDLLHFCNVAKLQMVFIHDERFCKTLEIMRNRPSWIILRIQILIRWYAPLTIIAFLSFGFLCIQMIWSTWSVLCNVAKLQMVFIHHKTWIVVLFQMIYSVFKIYSSIICIKIIIKQFWQETERFILISGRQNRSWGPNHLNI